MKRPTKKQLEHDAQRLLDLQALYGKADDDDIAPPGYWDDVEDDFEPMVASLELRNFILDFVAKWPAEQLYEQVIVVLSSALQRVRELEAKRRSAKS